MNLTGGTSETIACSIRCHPLHPRNPPHIAFRVKVNDESRSKRERYHFEKLNSRFLSLNLAYRMILVIDLVGVV